MKCKYCNEDKSEDEFSRRNGKPNSKCKACVVAYSKAHYQRNKQPYKERALADRPHAQVRWKEFITSLNLACAHCGENHPAVLDFHHTDPSIKEANPSDIRFSKKRFLKEIEKCVVLCSNCHRKLHWQERQELKLK